MDGMTGRGVLIETEEEREPSGTMGDREGRGRGGADRRRETLECKRRFFFLPPRPLSPAPPTYRMRKGRDRRGCHP